MIGFFRCNRSTKVIVYAEINYHQFIDFFNYCRLEFSLKRVRRKMLLKKIILTKYFPSLYAMKCFFFFFFEIGNIFTLILINAKVIKFSREMEEFKEIRHQILLYSLNEVSFVQGNHWKNKTNTSFFFICGVEKWGDE